jgi:hypothetical protein
LSHLEHDIDARLAGETSHDKTYISQDVQGTVESASRLMRPVTGRSAAARAPGSRFKIFANECGSAFAAAGGPSAIAAPVTRGSATEDPAKTSAITEVSVKSFLLKCLLHKRVAHPKNRIRHHPDTAAARIV